MEWFNIFILALAVIGGLFTVVFIMIGKIAIDTKNSKYDRFAVSLAYAVITLTMVTSLIERIALVIK